MTLLEIGTAFGLAMPLAAGLKMLSAGGKIAENK